MARWKKFGYSIKESPKHTNILKASYYYYKGYKNCRYVGRGVWSSNETTLRNKIENFSKTVCFIQKVTEQLIPLGEYFSKYISFSDISLKNNLQPDLSLIQIFWNHLVYLYLILVEQCENLFKTKKISNI